MAPTNPDRPSNGLGPVKGPHPSFIQVAKPYVFEQKLQECMTAIGATEAKEDNVRLQGVLWIDNVRKGLQLPVRTYNTACVYYHKFRLMHPENEYDFRDAAAAALFNACKIEDTLKKSRDILCAAYNLKLAPADHLSSDDTLFDSHSKTIVGLERLMLEASGFDFRNRYPQKILMKLVKSCSLDKAVGAVAYNICLDLYRTFAPLKQSTQTMALACLELAIRVCDIDLSSVKSEHGFDYDRWATTRLEIMETLLDLLDLYTHHRTATIVGQEYPLEKFISIRITLNQEASAHNYPRYTEWTVAPGDPKKATAPTPTTNGKTATPKSISPKSPSVTTPQSVGERGKDGTVRFMLDPARARDEKVAVHEFFRTEEVEEWVEIEVDITSGGADPVSRISPFDGQLSDPPSAPTVTSAMSSSPMETSEEEELYSPSAIYDIPSDHAPTTHSPPASPPRADSPMSVQSIHFNHLAQILTDTPTHKAHELSMSNAPTGGEIRLQRFTKSGFVQKSSPTNTSRLSGLSSVSNQVHDAMLIDSPQRTKYLVSPSETISPQLQPLQSSKSPSDLPSPFFKPTRSLSHAAGGTQFAPRRKNPNMIPLGTRSKFQSIEAPNAGLRSPSPFGASPGDRTPAVPLKTDRAVPSTPYDNNGVLGLSIRGRATVVTSPETSRPCREVMSAHSRTDARSMGEINSQRYDRSPASHYDTYHPPPPTRRSSPPQSSRRRKRDSETASANTSTSTSKRRTTMDSWRPGNDDYNRDYARDRKR